MRALQLKNSNLLYLQMAEEIMEIIRERNIQPHEPVPSEGELARQFGVSRMTSKLALNQLAEQGIVYRLPRRGTFLAKSAAVDRQDHPAGKSRSFAAVPPPPEQSIRKIAIVLPHMSDYTSRILTSVDREARKHGCEIMFRMSCGREDEDQCLSELAAGGIDGIILFPQGRKTCSDQVLKLKLDKFPLVIIDRIFREIQIDCVHHDHFKGSYMMARYLIDKGHRHIGYITTPSSGVTSLEDRYQGYIQALLDHGIAVNHSQLLIRSEECDLMQLKKLLPEQVDFLRNNPRMTAVMCGDDHIAGSAMYTALQLGISVPDQLSVVGFSDQYLSPLLPVPMTTVRQPTTQLAQSAFHLLMKRMNNSMEKQLTIKIETTITERESVKSLI